MKTCIQCGCSKPENQFERVYGRGALVHKHSQGCKSCINKLRKELRRLKRGSDGLSLQERFELYFEPIPWTGCWIWTGGTNGKNGQEAGEFNVRRPDGKWAPETAYRTAWKLYRGPIQEGMHVLHKCDNRLCVNPQHLFLGTHRDNMLDMIRKGRHRFSWRANGQAPL